MKFTSPKRSKLNDVWMKVLQSSCKVTAISKFKSTTASLSVSTASLKPISDAAVEHFAAQDFYGFLSPAVVGQGCFQGWWDQTSSICMCTQTPKTAWFEPDFGNICSSRLKRMAGECHQWLYSVLQISFLASNAFGMHAIMAQVTLMRE